MPFIPAGKPRELAPKGTHQAVCVQVIEKGTQKSRVEGWDDQPKIQFAFELIGKRTKEGKAFVEYVEHTYTNSPKGNLAGFLEGWLAVDNVKKFNIDECLGAPASITIIHKESKSTGNMYARITNVAGVSDQEAKRMKKHTEPLRSLYLNDKDWDQDTFDVLSSYLQKQIVASPEFEKLVEDGVATLPKKGKGDDSDEEEETPRRGGKKGNAKPARGKK